MTDENARKLGNYTIQAEIGRGGFAIVYRAENSTLKKLVALKLLSPALFEDISVQERFIREARTAAKLVHPNIVRVTDLDLLEGRLFMVMDYLPAGDLGNWLARHGRLNIQQSLSILQEVAEALDYAHQQGIVHGDVKPGNFLLTGSENEEDPGRARITDFGLLRAVEVSGASTSTTELVAGTPYYLSPEQVRGERSTAASDIYSLGVVTYELFTGQVPFNQGTPVSIFRQHLTEAPTPPESLNPLITPSLSAVILRAMAKDPGHRFATCREFIRVLADAAAEMQKDHFQELIEKARAALNAHDLGTARNLLQDAMLIMPQDPAARALVKQIEEMEVNENLYAEAANNLQDARKAAQDLRVSAPDLADPEGLLVELAPPPPPGWKKFWLSWRFASITGLIVLSLALLTGLVGRVTASLNQNTRATVIALVHTYTLTPTNTFTPTPTSTFTPTPTSTSTSTATNTFTPTPTPTPTLQSFAEIQLEDLNLQKELKVHTERINSLAFSSDGTRLISGSNDNTVGVWDVGSGKLIKILQGHTGDVTSVDISPDGNWILSGSADGTIRLWSNQTGNPTEMSYLIDRNLPVLKVLFSSDGNLVFVMQRSAIYAYEWSLNKPYLVNPNKIYACQNCLEMYYSSRGDALLFRDDFLKIISWSKIGGLRTLLEVSNTYYPNKQWINSLFVPKDGLEKEDYFYYLFEDPCGSCSVGDYFVSKLARQPVSYRTRYPFLYQIVDHSMVICFGFDLILYPDIEKNWESQVRQIGIAPSFLSVSSSKAWIALGLENGEIQMWSAPYWYQLTPTITTTP